MMDEVKRRPTAICTPDSLFHDFWKLWRRRRALLLEPDNALLSADARPLDSVEEPSEPSLTDKKEQQPLLTHKLMEVDTSFA